MEQIDERKEVAWNIIGLQARFIAQLIREGNRASMKGHLKNWFTSFSVIRENINHELKEDSAEELDDLELDIQNHMSHWAKYQKTITDGHDITPKLKSNYWKLERKIRHYQREVMSSLKKLGYFPLKQDKRFLAGLK